MIKSDSIVGCWKPVKGFEGFYEVSNRGSIRSVDRVINNRKYKGRVMSKQISSNGYQTVQLYNNGRYKKFLIHRLVAESFLLNPENKRCVNHIDGIKINNNLDNLEWVTHSENAKHAFAIGLSTISPRNHKAKIEASVKVNSRPVLRMGGGKPDKIYPSITMASKENSVNGSDITQVCRKKRKSAGGFQWNYTKSEVL